MAGGFLKAPEFPPFWLDVANECLWRHAETAKDERIPLTPKEFAVLQTLVEHAGQLVTRDELLDTVWDGTNVEPEVLNNQILNLRNALGDNTKSPVFIETVPRRGYRFIASVREGGAETNLRGMKPGGNFSRIGKLVGRQDALGELKESLEKALRGERQIVFITGEPGIGKTALADEFQRQAAAGLHGIRVVRGQGMEGFIGKEPYYPMLEALDQLCRGPGGDSVVRTLATQAPTWLAQFPAFIKREHRELLDREILGATRERMLREAGDALETLASASALLIVLEDLPWIDPSTVDLISALARRRGPAKLMFVGTYRQVDLESSNRRMKMLAEDLGVHRLSREIALGPLTEAEITEYLTREVSGTKAPEALAALLYRRSEGNPLFMLSILEHLSERGVTSLENGCWQLRVAPEALEEIDLGVPQSLQNMIESQINQLSPEEQRVLEAASPPSVGGSGFTVALRAAAGELDPEVFEAVCEGLSRRAYILRQAGSQKLRDGTISARYEFVHVFYREVCYGRISPARRKKLHRRLGEWIEAHWEAMGEATPWLADHFEQGEDWPRAVKYLLLSADTAGRRFEPRQAAETLEHALELTSRLAHGERTTREIEILEKLGAVYMMLADVAHTVQTYDDLATRAAQSGLIEVEMRALSETAWVLSWISSQRSLEALERILQLSDRQRDPLLRARTRAHCFAVRLFQRWSPQDAKEFHNAFAEIFRADDRRVLPPYLSDCGFIRWISSEYREARQRLIESRDIQFETAEENPYPGFPFLTGQRIILPLSFLFLGEWGKALHEIKDAITLSDKNADHIWGQTERLCLAFLHLHAMDFAGALAICKSAVPSTSGPEPRRAPDQPNPHPIHFRLCRILTGAALAGSGNHETALEYLSAARAEMDREAIISDWWWRMPMESALTELWLSKGDLAQAGPQAEKFLTVALATAEHTWQALAWEVSARVAMAAEEWIRAEECISKALSTIEGCEVPLAAWRVHGTAAELYARAGNGHYAEHPAAKHHRELSRTTIVKLANSLEEEEALQRAFLSTPAIRKILPEA